MSERSIILVSLDTFNRMPALNSCQHICEGRSIAGTIHRFNKEYVITGGAGNGRGTGWSEFTAYQVVDTANYTGKIKPRSYGSHGWGQGYTGMLIRFGKRSLICLDPVTFKVGHQVEQLALF
ncbi:hypothetical protein ACWKW6_12860 [Dyadobacter jiangsuensis]